MVPAMAGNRNARRAAKKIGKKAWWWNGFRSKIDETQMEDVVTNLSYLHLMFVRIIPLIGPHAQ